MQVSGKVAIVTGAASGLGAATARVLAAAGPRRKNWAVLAMRLMSPTRKVSKTPLPKSPVIWVHRVFWSVVPELCMANALWAATARQALRPLAA